MPRFATAVVDEIFLDRKCLQRVGISLVANGEKRNAYALTDVIGSVSIGDRVVVNLTAVDLGLGTGGWDVVHWNLSRDEWHRDGGGHIMKARYTSEQHECVAIEETAPSRDLAGMPVAVCELHSQMAVVAIAAKAVKPNLRIMYVMSDDAALPIAISDLVHELTQRRIIESTITCGQAFGGDAEAINVLSALRSVDADFVIVSQGPGVVGTATEFGFSGLGCVAHLHAATRAGGTPYFALRFSGADGRARHAGISHHSKTILGQAPVDVQVGIPSTSTEELDLEQTIVPVEVPELAPMLADAAVDVTSMGRSVSDDPEFFRYAAATGVLAATRALR